MKTKQFTVYIEQDEDGIFVGSIPSVPKKLIKPLKKLGFSERDAEGAHVFFKHEDSRTTVIPIHNRELS
jgi:predicted RNA binding protein YcfA (HicA-like mRNA interferase family)